MRRGRRHPPRGGRRPPPKNAHPPPPPTRRPAPTRGGPPPPPGAAPDSRNIAALTDRIAPSIREVAAAEHDPERRYAACVAANVRASVSQLGHGSRILEDLTLAGRIRIAGAIYAVETGLVSILD